MKKLVLITFLITILANLYSNEKLIENFKLKHSYEGTCLTGNKLNFRRLNTFMALCFLTQMDNNRIYYVLPQVKIYENEELKLKAIMYFDHKKKEQYIAIRGSKYLKNWLKNFTFNKVYDRKLKMNFHNGFHQCAMAVYNGVKHQMRKNYKTTVIGHSLGGAIGIILAMHFHDDKMKIKELVTYGEPRVTDRYGSQIINSTLPIIRIVNCCDIVPMVPPTTMTKYYHVGLGVIMLKNNLIAFDNGESDGIGNNSTFEDDMMKIRDEEIKRDRIKYLKEFKKFLDTASTQKHKSQFYQLMMHKKYSGYKVVKYSNRYNHMVPFLPESVIERFERESEGFINLKQFDKYLYDFKK